MEEAALLGFFFFFWENQVKKFDEFVNESKFG